MDKYLKKCPAEEQRRELLVDKCVNINKTIFKNETFRPYQLEIILDALSGKDVFVVMPTGGGKSLCYALPSVITQGITVVISPLISLIEDQVAGFIQKGIPAAYLTSTSTPKMLQSVFTDLSRGRHGLQPFLKLIYVTPERIVNHPKTLDIFKQLYDNEILARFVIDESHCISSWGHDFRKDYGKLNLLKESYPEVPIMALTSTARNSVRYDIIRLLNIPNCAQHSAGYDRPNLFFEVIEKDHSEYQSTYRQIFNFIQQHNFFNSTGIVYCMTKDECQQMADFLRGEGLTADYYHAGQNKSERSTIQGQWLRGEIKVVCATIAYGMGIDKSNVRYVIHHSLAKSIEGYYQEAGRAGRDGQRSHCVIFYSQKDVKALRSLMRKPPRFQVSEKDEKLLGEIKGYCESTLCRRKVFADVFLADGPVVLTGGRSATSAVKIAQSHPKRLQPFEACGNMCDNCIKASTGLPVEPVLGKPPKATFQRASQIAKRKTLEAVKDNDNADWLQGGLQRQAAEPKKGLKAQTVRTSKDTAAKAVKSDTALQTSGNLVRSRSTPVSSGKKKRKRRDESDDDDFYVPNDPDDDFDDSLIQPIKQQVTSSSSASPRHFPSVAKAAIGSVGFTSSMKVAPARPQSSANDVDCVIID